MQTRAADLIKGAYYLSNVKDPGEEILGYEAQTGLDVLNSIITQWSGLNIYIPTYTKLTFPTSPGVFEYEFEPPLVQILEASLIDSLNVKTYLGIIDLKRQNLLNYSLSETAPTRPNLIFLQNSAAEIMTHSTVFLYPVPNAIYSVTMYAKQMLTIKTYEEIILDIPPFCYKALRYQMGNDLSIEFASALSPDFQKEFDKLMRELRAANKRDITVKNTNPFNDRWRRFRPFGGWYG